jgi:hypothetical protein
MCQSIKTVLVQDGSLLYSSLDANWFVTAERPFVYDEAMEVIGYHPDWIDADFNPNGTRVGFFTDDGRFQSAKWLDYQDTYINGDTSVYDESIPALPTHYMFMPYKPGIKYPFLANFPQDFLQPNK